MKSNLTIIAASVALVAFVAPPVQAAAAKPAEPNGDQILKQMCAKLAAAQKFSFTAHREIDPALMPGSEVAQSADVEVTVLRPNKVMAEAKSKKGVRHLYANGQTFTLFDGSTNFYSTIPMRKSIDGLVDQIDQQYGFVPPLAEFTVSNPYKEFRQQARAVSYVGRSTLPAGFLNLGSVECEHLALTGQEADAEAWIGVDDHLLKKLVATFHLAGKPQVRISFSAWNLAATATDADFNFTPPKGAQKILMRPVTKASVSR